MKKKSFMALIFGTLLLSGVFSFTACDDDESTDDSLKKAVTSYCKLNLKCDEDAYTGEDVDYCVEDKLADLEDLDDSCKKLATKYYACEGKLSCSDFGDEKCDDEWNNYFQCYKSSI